MNDFNLSAVLLTDNLRTIREQKEQSVSGEMLIKKTNLPVVNYIKKTIFPMNEEHNYSIAHWTITEKKMVKKNFTTDRFGIWAPIVNKMSRELWKAKHTYVLNKGRCTVYSHIWSIYNIKSRTRSSGWKTKKLKRKVKINSIIIQKLIIAYLARQFPQVLLQLCMHSKKILWQIIVIYT